MEEGDEEDEEAHLGLAALPGLEEAKGAQGVPGLGPTEHPPNTSGNVIATQHTPKMCHGFRGPMGVLVWSLA